MIRNYEQYIPSFFIISLRTEVIFQPSIPLKKIYKTTEASTYKTALFRDLSEFREFRTHEEL